MLKLEINHSEDWNEVSDNLRKLFKNMPEFYNDFLRLKVNINNEIRKLAIIELKLRRGRSDHYEELKKDQISKINALLRTVSKQHLIATLSKR